MTTDNDAVNPLGEAQALTVADQAVAAQREAQSATVRGHWIRSAQAPIR